MDVFGGRSAVAVSLVGAMMLAGCVAALDPLEDAGEAAAVFSIAGDSAPVGALLVFSGSELQGECADANECMLLSAPFSPHRPYEACLDSNCERTPLVIGDAAAGGTLVAAARWAVQDEEFSDLGEYLGAPHVSLRLALVPAGTVDEDGLWLAQSKYGAVGRFEDVAPGAYELVAIADWGRGAYDVAFRVLPSDDAPAEGELLPDLVMGAPRQLRIETPLGREADPALVAVGSAGCGPDEIAEEEARRCLRFASDIGNAGVGTLELFMRKQDALLARAGAASAEWVQRVRHADGSVREEPVSGAEYHPTHGHYHIQAFAQTSLYAFDEASGERGELLVAGGKTGFCVIDGGPLSLQSAFAELPAFFGDGCCYMTVFCELDAASEAEEFLMGIGAGWFDVYPWWRSGQYVELTGIGDGVYELVSVVNPESSVIEADATNNGGGVVFRLVGDEVELVSSWTSAPVGAFEWSGAAADA